MIISVNAGGLCNRLKSLISCIRYADENDIDVRVFWEKSNDYNKRSHLLNCRFNKLFKNFGINFFIIPISNQPSPKSHPSSN